MEPGPSEEAGGAPGQPCASGGRHCSVQPEPVPRLLKRSLVIFSGGKLEIARGRTLLYPLFDALRHCPDALLIAAWGNMGHVGLNTIAASPHVEGAPERGRADAIGPWPRLMGSCLNVFSCPAW